MAPARAGDLFFTLCHADGNTDGKNQGEVGKHNVAAAVEYLQDSVDGRARSHDTHEVVGFEHGFVGKRPADTQK